MITFVFWGSTIFSLFIALFVIATRQWKYMLASIIFYLPFSLYLNATPRFRGILALILCHVIIALAVYYKKKHYLAFAWVAFIVIAAFPLWIASLVW